MRHRKCGVWADVAKSRPLAPHPSYDDGQMCRVALPCPGEGRGEAQKRSVGVALADIHEERRAAFMRCLVKKDEGERCSRSRAEFGIRHQNAQQRDDWP